MNDFITNLVIWLYTHGTAVIVIILVTTVTVVWQLLRLLYARPITAALDRQQALIAAGGLVLLILLPTPVMTLIRPDASTFTALGRGLYQHQCRQCHGDRGSRLPGIALNSREYLDSLGDATLLSAIRDGKGVMPAFGRSREGPLTDDEVAMVARYLKDVATTGGPGVAVKPAAKPGAPSGAAASPAEGKALYAKQCEMCHGANGSRVPKANLASREYIQANEAGLFKAIAEGKGTMPGFAEEISADQINQIVAYLRAQVGLTDAAPGAGGTPAPAAATPAAPAAGTPVPAAAGTPAPAAPAGGTPAPATAAPAGGTPAPATAAPAGGTPAPATAAPAAGTPPPAATTTPTANAPAAPPANATGTPVPKA